MGICWGWGSIHNLSLLSTEQDIESNEKASVSAIHQLLGRLCSYSIQTMNAPTTATAHNGVEMGLGNSILRYNKTNCAAYVTVVIYNCPVLD